MTAPAGRGGTASGQDLQDLQDFAKRMLGHHSVYSVHSVLSSNNPVRPWFERLRGGFAVVRIVFLRLRFRFLRLRIVFFGLRIVFSALRPRFLGVRVGFSALRIRFFGLRGVFFGLRPPVSRLLLLVVIAEVSLRRGGRAT